MTADDIAIHLISPEDAGEVLTLQRAAFVQGAAQLSAGRSMHPMGQLYFIGGAAFITMQPMIHLIHPCMLVCRISNAFCSAFNSSNCERMYRG